MKKLLLLALVSGALNLCAMEIDGYKSTKQEETGLQECIYESYEPSQMQEKTAAEIDAENKKIINLFNVFAGTVNKMDAEDRESWCFSMELFTSDIMLKKARLPYEGFSELQTAFRPMKDSKKRQWQEVINNSFKRMYKESIRKDNCFSAHVKEYLKADIIVPLFVNTLCEIQKKN